MAVTVRSSVERNSWFGYGDLGDAQGQMKPLVCLQSVTKATESYIYRHTMEYSFKRSHTCICPHSLTLSLKPGSYINIFNPSAFSAAFTVWAVVCSSRADTE